MALTNGKHIVKDIDGTPCTIIEEKASKERVDFLQSLLTFNNLEVKVSKNTQPEGSSEPETFTIGVTNLVFNPVIAVYAKQLYTKQGWLVTPNIWNQITTNEHMPYWTIGRPVLNIYKDDLESNS